MVVISGKISRTQHNGTLSQLLSLLSQTSSRDNSVLPASLLGDLAMLGQSTAASAKSAGVKRLHGGRLLAALPLRQRILSKHAAKKHQKRGKSSRAAKQKKEKLKKTSSNEKLKVEKSKSSDYDKKLKKGSKG